jgi:hypothetical protein
MLAWLNSYAISDSSVIGRSYPYGSVQKFPTFQPISSAQIDIKVNKGGKIGSWAGILVAEWFLDEGPGEDSKFVL